MGYSRGALPQNLVANSHRITLSATEPVTIIDQAGKATVYCLPFIGEYIALFYAAAWRVLNYTGGSVAVPNTTATPFDIFARSTDGSTVTLSAESWTDDTTRAQALTKLNGILVMNSDNSKKYLATLRTGAVQGQTEDTGAQRFLWNLYNQVPRKFLKREATISWSYSSGTVRYANADSNNKVEFVTGYEGQNFIDMSLSVVGGSTVGATAAIGIGLDSGTAFSTDAFFGNTHGNNNSVTGNARFQTYPTIGYHFCSWLEQGNGAQSDFASNGFSGLYGSMLA